VKNSRLKAIAFALTILFASGSSWLFADGPLQLAGVTPDAEWNAVFDRTDGWTGADCAGSVDLGDGRTLWMFGDTWIGKIRDGKRQPGATMVNNSVAVHPTDKAAPWRPPDPRSVQFVWGLNDKQGRPTAWAVPPAIAGQAAADHDWLWCNGGGVVGVTRDGKGRRLIVFFFRVRRNPQGKGVWAFTTVGTSFAVIDNVADLPERWRPKIYDMPDLGRMKGAHDDLELLWGMSAYRERSISDEAGHVRIFGTLKKAPFETALVMARVPSATIDVFPFEFFNGSEWKGSFQLFARPLAAGLVSEFSVEEMDHGGRPKWVLIQSEPLLGKRIFVRTAPQPEGPWSAPRTIYSVPDVAKSRAYFTYAAKGHAALSRPGELLVTYLVNSQNFGDLVTDTTIYRPKFLRVPVAVIFGK
jgi:hypothetical protein